MERRREATRRRVWLARGIAVAADLLQIVAFPLFAPGIASPWNDALDLAMAAAMTWLVGWHWAFLPSFVAEVVPGLTLVPTWTAAAFFVTRGKWGGAAAEASRPGAIDTQVVRSTSAGPGAR
ncbi:MAG: hypothetical protein ACRD3M_14660 [Thermoanaerobaculia bacterium]